MSFERLRGPGRRIFAAAIWISLAAGCETAAVAPPPPAPALTLGADTYEVRSLDRQPRPQFVARPAYPLAMRRAGISGQVVVEFIVDPSGNVSQARAVSAPADELAEAAVQCVLRWKFSPGMKNGQPVSTIMSLPIDFGLNDGR